MPRGSRCYPEPMGGSYRTPIVESEAHRLATARARAEVEKRRAARRKARLRQRAKHDREWLTEERLRYQIAWEGYWRGTRVASGVFVVIGLLPPLIAAEALMDGALVRGAGALVNIAACLGVALASLLLGWIASLATAEIAMRSFRCPRCERQFQPSRQDVSRCQHCGLALGAVDGR